MNLSTSALFEEFAVPPPHLMAEITPAQHAAEHERRWPKEIYGPYRVFPDLATARDWCAHCNVWIGGTS
ncbi:hypothetical protein ACQEVF_20105 [Nonomuraea polychroma]|uniref:hypothetical protein n=1 Tax=Nonomuraea polychroma TaxID=46176 RepID=UPI003D8BA775